MVQVRVQPLYSMASSIAHDFFRQEANTLHLLCVLIIKGVTSLGPHLRPVCHQAPFEIVIKKVEFDLNTVCFSWTSGDARGLGLLFMVCACVVGLRENRLTWMRGTWGLFWWSAHVSTIPFTWLRRAKAWGRTVHASHHHATRGLPINVYVLYPMLPICALIGRERSREFFDDVPYANESRDSQYNRFYCSCCALIGYRLK